MTAPPAVAECGSGLPDCLAAGANAWPERLALAFEEQTWSFRELENAVTQSSRMLAPTLAEGGGRLGFLSANRPGIVFAVHAARQLGVSFVPLNWRQSPEELAWQIADACISVLLVDDAHMATAESATDRHKTRIIPIASLESDRHLVADQAATAPLTPSCTIGANREVAVIYTSGTSGRPKGARLTYGNVWFSAVASSFHLGHHLDDSWLAVLPLFHVGGLSMLFRGVIAGVPIHLHERFDPQQTLAAIDAGATMVSLVPTMLSRLIETRGAEHWPDSLRCILLGGAAAAPSLIAACLSRGIPIAPTYGLTETASQAATLLPAEVDAKPGSSGRPLPMTQIRILGENGPAAPGTPGDIAVAGPTVVAGYLGQDTDEARTLENQWFVTGDIGYLDEDGYLYVLDRRTDLIISGGENVYPAEIERCLLDHPLVVDAGVVGTPHDVWGSRPVAALVWHGDPAVAADALTAHTRQRLAPYKVPDRFVLVDELPRSASGKLLRRCLHEMLNGPST